MMIATFGESTVSSAPAGRHDFWNSLRWFAPPAKILSALRAN